MTRLTDDELKALKAGASKGPWVIGDYYGDKAIMADGKSIMGDATYYPWVPESAADWSMIAAAPDLLDEVIELRAKVKAADRMAEAIADNAWRTPAEKSTMIAYRATGAA